MELFLLRHGAAEASTSSDQQRALTDRGREEVNWVLSSSAQSLESIGLMAVSPYLRTRQTAQIAEVFLAKSHPVEVFEADFLTPDSDPKFLYTWIERQVHTRIMLVTHQPLVNSFLDELCGLRRGQYLMGTGALAYIKMDMIGIGLGELQWLRQK